MPRYQSQESQQQKRVNGEFRHAHQARPRSRGGQSSVASARVGYAGKTAGNANNRHSACAMESAEMAN